jgi:hypothetical protein
MRIVINSNYRFYERSLSVLLPTITEKDHNIEVIIGGSPWEYKKEVRDGINYYFVNYDNTGYTALIFVKEHPELVSDQPYYLFIHDTTKLGPLFFEKLRASLESKIKKYGSKEEFEKNATNFKLTDDDISMDMGLYRSDFFLHVNNANMLPEKNTDLSEEAIFKIKKMGYGLEDMCTRDKEGLQSERRIVTEIPSPYGSDVKRIQEYFPGLDFYKFKSNWSYNMLEINL